MKKNEVICTDPDQMQFVASVGEEGCEEYLFAQLVRIENGPGCHGTTGVYMERLSASDFTEEELEEAVKSYYTGGMSEIRSSCKDRAMEIALECAFEESLAGSNKWNAGEEVPNEKYEEVYETVKSVLQDALLHNRAGGFVELSDEMVYGEAEKDER